MASGLDYASVQLSSSWLSQVKNGGYDFVIRYISDHTGGKVITFDEQYAITHAKLGLGLVWETENVRPIGYYDLGYTDQAHFHYWSTSQAYANGKIDGAAANTQAGTIGFPGNLPLYFAIDFDPDVDNPTLRRTLIDSYMKGILFVLQLWRVGVYAGQKMVDYCFDNHLAQFFWQTSSWSYGVISTHTHIYQDRHSFYYPPSGGVNVDHNITEKANIDQYLWMPTSTPTPPPPSQPVDPVHTSSQVNFPMVTSTSFSWDVSGLQSPFNQTYYKQVRLTPGNSPTPTSGWMTSIIAPANNNTIHTTQWNTCNFPATVAGTTKTYYAWAQVASDGAWYPVGTGTCSVTFAVSQSTTNVVSGVATLTSSTTVTGNSKTVTGLTNGKEYWFRIKVTKAGISQTSDFIKLTPVGQVVEINYGGGSSRAVMFE